MEVSKLPNGELRIRAKHKTAPDKRFGDFAGCLKNHARVHLSVDDMNRIIADAAADTDTPP
nr:hypothetical protein [Neisseria sp. HSC-16F19]